MDPERIIEISRGEGRPATPEEAQELARLYLGERGPVVITMGDGHSGHHVTIEDRAGIAGPIRFRPTNTDIADAQPSHLTSVEDRWGPCVWWLSE